MRHYFLPASGHFISDARDYIFPLISLPYFILLLMLSISSLLIADDIYCETRYLL